MLKTLIKFYLFTSLLYSCSTYSDEEILNFDKEIKEHIQEK